MSERVKAYFAMLGSLSSEDLDRSGDEIGFVLVGQVRQLGLQRFEFLDAIRLDVQRGDKRHHDAASSSRVSWSRSLNFWILLVDIGHSVTKRT